ncbi:hypothetical protein [Luteimonas deserti]|uniref:hypothetical protein n=1 Tax=Luteimonas deserti TaxID=2752306 RepID=UPI001C5CADF1|nr:hypothetical protein [Luteimonas deserti]
MPAIAGSTRLSRRRWYGWTDPRALATDAEARSELSTGTARAQSIRRDEMPKEPGGVRTPRAIRFHEVRTRATVRLLPLAIN